MKRFLKYALLSIVLIIVWTIVIFSGTNKGWWYSPFTKQKESVKFVASAQQELKNEFVGNLAMAVFENGKLVTETFYTSGDKVDKNTIFQVASLSKFVSAIGIMRLVQENKLDLDMPVSRYLTRWRLPDSPFDNNEVTARRLLSHTAGLTDDLGYAGFKNIEDVQSLESSLSKAKDTDPGKDGRTQVGILPGSEWRYSGGGFTLLQLIVEEISGKSFDTFMRTEIFEPLKMHSSFYQWDETFRDRLSNFYHADGSRAEHLYYTSQAATSLYTTLEDLEKLFNLFDNESNVQKPLLPEFQKMMWRVEANKLGTPIYGLGTLLFAEIEESQFVVGHDGQSTPPINSAFRFNTKTKDGIIILTTGNTDIATRIASDWVFLKTGKVGALLFAMQQKKMTSSITMGSITIIILLALIAFWRERFMN